jgi:hydroxypyruvate isomerase
LPAGNWAAGDRGIAADPSRIEEFRAGVDVAIDYARALNCTRINCLAGIIDPANAVHQRRVLCNNLAFAAERLDRHSITLLLEPISTRAIPAFLVSTSRQAVDVIATVGRPNLKIQYDIFHMQVMEGDIAHRIAELLPSIGHIQIADNPGRHEPGTGELSFSFLFNWLDRIGYEGWVGCEYAPLTSTAESLRWLAEARSRDEQGASN